MDAGQSVRLHAEVAGPVDGPALVFIHPNPLDRSCWVFQAAYFSTWCRTILIDLPGYGASPPATGFTMPDVAQWCWDATREASSGPAVIVGCSVGANVAQHMYHLDPQRTRGVVISGTGYSPAKAFATERANLFRERGLDYRSEYALEVFAQHFRDSEQARWMVELITARNPDADLDTIVEMFEELGKPDPDWLQRDLQAPVLIVTGTEDRKHRAALEFPAHFPDAALQVIEDAGHACHFERPAVYNAALRSYLERVGVPTAGSGG